MLFRRRKSHARRSLLRLPKQEEQEMKFWKGFPIAIGISLLISTAGGLVSGYGSIKAFLLSAGVGLTFAVLIWGFVVLFDTIARRYNGRMSERTAKVTRGAAWVIGGVIGWLIAYELMSLIVTGRLVAFSGWLMELLLTSAAFALVIGAVITLIRMGAERVRRETEFLSQKELLTTELETARNLQRSLLPVEDSRLFGFDISGTTRPAVEIGGDYYDYLSFADGTKGILVADAAGKGIPAALVMAKFQGMAQALSLHVADPLEFFTGLNDTLRIRLDRRSFITAGMMTIDFEDHCAFYRAGHNPLFYFCAENRAIEQLKPQGLALGLTHGTALGASLSRLDFTMRSGDVALLCSDGLNEATNMEGEAYGDDRVAASLRRAAGMSAVEVKNALLADLSDFVGDAEPHDDITIVVVKKL
jgi:serine phosphatase RsbU (regulator of sigma subunit)